MKTEEQLALISEMISQAKGNLSNNSFYFLFWGWLIAGINLSIFTAMQYQLMENPMLLWMLTIPGSIVTGIYSSRQHKKTKVSNHYSGIIKTIWLSFGICLITIIVFSKIIASSVNPLVLLATAMATTISGETMRFKPLYYGGFFLFIGAIVAFLIPVQWQFLVASIAIVGGYLVPGYQLKRLEQK